MYPNERVFDKVLFKLGDVSITPRALAELHRAKVGAATLLRRHVRGDWGECLCYEGWLDNDAALEQGVGVASLYRLPGTGEKIWVRTSADGSETSISMKKEYWLHWVL